MKKSRIAIIISISIVCLMLSQTLAVAPSPPQDSSAQVQSANLQAVASANTNYSSQLKGSAVQNYSVGNSSQQKSVYDANGVQVPSKYVYLPSTKSGIMNRTSLQGSLYTSSPAPMGVADYGLYNNSGKITSYSYSTTSFEGTASVSNLTSLYLLNGAPRSVSIQLNSVLKNVTLGNSNKYVFWNQNVILYSARDQQIQLIDNIWNFSSPTATMTNSTLSGYGGTLIPNSLYYDVGPVINVTYPFTVSVYLNSTLQNGKNTIFFNYSVKNGGPGGITKTGSYDNVTFNSSSTLAKPAKYYVSGSQDTPLGFLPYDSEFAIGGPGGGSTTSIYGINATMSLDYFNSTSGTYNSVKSAYDAGTSTGETANGIAVSWTSQHQAVLTPGPSMLYGMWGVSNSPISTYTGSINPAESFLFVSNSSRFNNSTSSWVPLGKDGSYNFKIPSGTYSAAVFSNWHDPFYSSLDAINGSITSLASNNTRGIYAPVYVFGNQQLSQIASGGSGTALDPYVITGAQKGPILQVFGRFNDFGFPLFSGILVSGTTDNAYVSGMPSFYIHYSNYELPFLAYSGLPSVNYLNMEFYNDSNIALLNTSFISGWFSANLALYFPSASVVFWNTTHSLVSSNYFSSMGDSLFIYNDNGTVSNITVWGNEFSQNGIVQSSAFSNMNVAGAPTGLMLFSSGNLVYNNIFDVYQTAVSPSIDFYTGGFVNYTNQWNISREPLSYFRIVLGQNLTGGVMESGPTGIKYQAGNFWWNYLGNGSQMYNDSGLISFGGDKQPLVHSVYEITFTQTGLPSGMEWYVIIDNGSFVLHGTGKSITFYEPNGSYFIQIYSSSYLANQSSGFVIVSGMPQAFSISFSKLYYLSFVESGLPSGTFWSITVNGVTGFSNTNAIEYLATNGSYLYEIGNVSGYYPISSTGSLSIIARNTTVYLEFLPVAFPVTFTETGLPAGTQWGIFVDGQKVTGTTSSLHANLPNGSYVFTIMGVLGYSPAYTYGTINVDNGSANVQVTFQGQKYLLTFTENGLPSGASWSVTIGNQTFRTTNQSIILQGSTGLYNYSVSGSSGFSALHHTGSVNLNTNVSVPVTFKRGGLTMLQIFDYALFAGSIAVLAFAVYTVRKRA